jgi:hypothetical protein
MYICYLNVITNNWIIMYTIDKSKSQSIIYYKEWGNVYTYTLDSPIYMYMYFIYII